MAGCVDRRLHRRWPLNVSAWVRVNDQVSPISCTVENVSAGGARLALVPAVELPREFELEIPTLDLRVEVSQVWSQGEHHGVLFMWPQHTLWS